jgi:hypothetical protein
MVVGAELVEAVVEAVVIEEVDVLVVEEVVLGVVAEAVEVLWPMLLP